MPRGSPFPLFPTPDEILRTYLVTGERVIHVDRPALNAFVIIQFREVFVAVVLFAVFLWAVVTGSGAGLALLAFIAFDIVLIWLVVRRLQEFYTRYVITTFRVIRMSGIFTRQNVWIPWVKITDLSFKQSLLGRMFGYATIRIESASGVPGLRSHVHLRRQIRFNRSLVEMINAKHGTVAPTWAATID